MARFCNKCNYPIEEGGLFCTECGSNDIRDDSAPKKLGTEKVEEPKTEAPTTVPETNAPTTKPVPANVGVTVSGKAPEEDETPEVDGYAVSLPQVGKIQDSKEDEVKNNFGEVPDYMSGDKEPEKKVMQIDIKKDVLHQDASKPTKLGVPPVINSAPRRRKKDNPGIWLFVGAGGFLALAVLLMFCFYYGKAVGELGPGGPFKGTLNSKTTTANEYDYTTMFNTENSFRVGNDDFGYISIPNTWVNFKDVNGNSTLQYTDNGSWIVTIYAMPTTQMTAEAWANSVYKAIVNNGGQNIQTSTSTIDVYNALKITAYYPKQKKYLATWFFESKAGKTHYLAIEGPESSGDPYNSIYSFKEDQ